MKQFEDRLRDALRREEAPAGFTGRVLARVAAGEAVRPGPLDRLRRWFELPPMRWALAGVLLAALAGGAEFERRRRIQARAEAAKEQVMLALRITAEQLQVARRGVNRLNDAW